MRYRFGELELDTQACRLSRSGRALTVRPRVFDVLRFLIERRGRLVSKAELVDALWPEDAVDEAASRS